MPHPLGPAPELGKATPPPRRGPGARLAAAALDRLTPTLAWGALQAMAVALRLRPGYRTLLATRHPCDVAEQLTAGILFTVPTAGIAVHARFGGGRLRVGLGPLVAPDVTVRFREPEHLRAFFRPGADLFGMILRGELVSEGNLALLARFGHVATAVARGGQPLPLRPRPPKVPPRWEDLPVPPAGEPCREPPGGETTLADPHLAHLTLDDFPALKRGLWVHRSEVPAICTERARLLTDFELRHPDPPRTRGERALRQARALHHLLTQRRAQVEDDDLLAGATTSQRVGVLLFPELGATLLWPELLTVQGRELNPYRLSEVDRVILAEEVLPHWSTRNLREWARAAENDPEALRLDERFALYFLWKNHAVSHTIADLPRVLSQGLRALRDEALARAAVAPDGDAAQVQRAFALALDGVMDYAARLAAAAEGRAAALPEGPDTRPARQRLRALAAVLRRVPAEPARTLHEAIQAVWIVFLCLHQENMNAGLSLGRLDVWLQPYLARDLAAAAEPAERERRLRRAVELVGALMLKCTDHLPLVPDIGNRLFGGSSSDQVITLGGVDAAGQSAVCDMTWIFLKATEMLRLRDPNVNARVCPGVTSAAYLRRLCELNLLTRATPSIHNDAAMVPVLEGLGFTTADARDWSATGCVEPTSCGRHMGHTGSVMLNLVAPLEMALGDGAHPRLGERVGPATGDPRGFASFGEVWQAYRTQLEWVIDRAVEGNNLLGRAHQQCKPTPLLSALLDGPGRVGRDAIDGGARYNTTGTAMIGLSDVVDSLAVIEHLVYARRRVDLATLLAALAADFRGHAGLLAEIERLPCRFGTGHPRSQALAADVREVVATRLGAAPHYRGGRYLAGYWSMSNHVAFGILSGALPSGRRAGEPFTPGLTPSPRSGAPLTEQLRAVAELDPAAQPNNIAFNVKLVPGPDDPHAEVVDRMVAYVQGYLDLGGMQLQLNVVSSDTLRDAVAHPERYGDLLVRISGYNAYFVDLNRDLQRELIARMAHPA